MSSPIQLSCLAGLAGVAAVLSLGAACAPTPPPAAPVSAPVAAARATTPPLTLTYLGVAGWQLTDGQRVVLVDPYFTRPTFAPGTPLTSDPAAVAARAPARADLIVVGHSHIDHVLDAPAVAKRTGASVMGTLSTANYARAFGLPAEQIVPVKGGEDYAFEGFSVRVIPGLHSALDEKHSLSPFTSIASDKTLPTTMDEFGEGGTLNYLVRFGGRQILIIGSANYIERELEGLRPDLAIVAVGLRHELHDYSCRLMRALGAPPVVLPNHFDVWTKPVETPLSEGAQRDLAAFAEEIRACAPATRVVVPRPFSPLVL